MIPCAVHFVDALGIPWTVETVLPGIVPADTKIEFVDTDRDAVLIGIVTRVLCSEIDGDLTVTVYTRPCRDEE